MTEKKGDDHLDEIRTVLRRHASGRSDDTTFHHDDHAQTKKPEASSGRRDSARGRAAGGGLPGAAAMFVQVPKR